MGIGSIWHWLVLALVVAIVFMPKRIPDLMGDVAKGLRSFRRGLREDADDKPPEPPP